jgi:hypothetical protein
LDKSLAKATARRLHDRGSGAGGDAMSVFVWGLFDDEAHAEKAMHEVIESSFPPEEISVLMRGEHGEVEKGGVEHKTYAPHGAALGAVLGAAGAVAMIAVPGGLLAAGPLALLLQAAGMGAVTGGVGGALAGLYWWHQELDVPDDAFERGQVLVGVTTNDERSEEAKQSIERAQPSRAGVSPTPPPR